MRPKKYQKNKGSSNTSWNRLGLGLRVGLGLGLGLRVKVGLRGTGLAYFNFRP